MQQLLVWGYHHYFWFPASKLFVRINVLFVKLVYYKLNCSKLNIEPFWKSKCNVSVFFFPEHPTIKNSTQRKYTVSNRTKIQLKEELKYDYELYEFIQQRFYILKKFLQCKKNNISWALLVWWWQVFQWILCLSSNALS